MKLLPECWLYDIAITGFDVVGDNTFVRVVDTDLPALKLVSTIFWNSKDNTVAQLPKEQKVDEVALFTPTPANEITCGLEKVRLLNGDPIVTDAAEKATLFRIDGEDLTAWKAKITFGWNSRDNTVAELDPRFKNAGGFPLVVYDKSLGR